MNQSAFESPLVRPVVFTDPVPETINRDVKQERGLEMLETATLHSPVGYIRSLSARDGDGDFVIDPDEQVQSVVRLIFDKFSRRGSLSGVLRWLVKHDVKLPIRPHFGSTRGELEWRRPDRMTLRNILHHPIYAGLLY